MSRRRRGLAGVAGVAGVALAGVGLPLAGGLRVRLAERPPTDRWQRLPIEPRGATLLGFSFRVGPTEALGLAPRETLDALLELPFDLVRLTARWDRMEPEPGAFEPGDLDWQLEAVERAGRRAILCTGAVKGFGYPETFVPAHYRSPREGRLLEPGSDPRLFEAAVSFGRRVVERYRDRPSVAAWQVEHEAVDPLGMEHSWRLGTAWVGAEVRTVREADPSRPVMLNGFLPASLAGRLQQRWRTRDQRDSVEFALRQADLVGIDWYPRLGLLRLGPWTAYLDGAGPGRAALRALVGRAAAAGRGWLVSEGQAEPWEALTTPPAPRGRWMSSCRAEDVIETYDSCLRLGREAGAEPYAYLFWGAEYWLRRARDGDPSYLEAGARVLGES